MTGVWCAVCRTFVVCLWWSWSHEWREIQQEVKKEKYRDVKQRWYNIYRAAVSNSLNAFKKLATCPLSSRAKLFGELYLNQSGCGDLFYLQYLSLKFQVTCWPKTNTLYSLWLQVLPQLFREQEPSPIKQKMLKTPEQIYHQWLNVGLTFMEIN